jgi:hypothetical protein
MQSGVGFKASSSTTANDDDALEALLRYEVWRGSLSPSVLKSKAGWSSGFWINGPFNGNTCTGYDALNRPRALFLLSHCKHTFIFMGYLPLC